MAEDWFYDEDDSLHDDGPLHLQGLVIKPGAIGEIKMSEAEENTTIERLREVIKEQQKEIDKLKEAIKVLMGDT